MLKYFIKNYDSNFENKKYVNKMCEEFREKFIERIDNNTWMSESSKKAAKIKAEKIVFVCGYPEASTIPDITYTASSESSFVNKYMDLYKQAFIEWFRAFYSAENEKEKLSFVMVFEQDLFDAQATYNEEKNSVEILPTNLIDPICNTSYADAYNYAVIGATTIGHELCHAFDASGSQRDEYGETKDWWAVSDKLNYEEKKDEMSRLFSMFTTPESATSLDGANTLTENMADYGGICVAYDLFVEKKIAEGFGGEKLREQKKMFFQSFAIAWSTLQEDKEMVALIESQDIHAPYCFRTNGNACQIDDWYDLYEVQKGDRYYLAPGQRVILW